MIESVKPVLPPRGEMSVKRLLDADPCPCRSGKTFETCCRGDLKEGLTVENTLHLLFEEHDGCSTCAANPTSAPHAGEPSEIVPCASCGSCRCVACGAARGPLSFYAFMSQKMNGVVPPDEIVANIAKRLWSPPLQRALDKLTWHAIGANGLKMTMQLPEQRLVQGPPAKALLDAQGRPVKDP